MGKRERTRYQTDPGFEGRKKTKETINRGLRKCRKRRGTSWEVINEWERDMKIVQDMKNKINKNAVDKKKKTDKLESAYMENGWKEIDQYGREKKLMQDLRKRKQKNTVGRRLRARDKLIREIITSKKNRKIPYTN